jgi:hypothetical protein
MPERLRIVKRMAANPHGISLIRTDILAQPGDLLAAFVSDSTTLA